MRRHLAAPATTAVVALLVASCGLLPTPTPTAIGGIPLACTPAEWAPPPEDLIGCGDAALVAKGALPMGLPPIAEMRFEYGPRCEPRFSEQFIRGLPPDQQGEYRRRNEAPCPPLEPTRGLVVFTFAVTNERMVPESYVDIERADTGEIRVVSDLLPWCAPPLECE